MLLLCNIPYGDSSAGRILNVHPSPQLIKREESVQGGLSSLKGKWKQKTLVNPSEYYGHSDSLCRLRKPSPGKLHACQPLSKGRSRWNSATAAANGWMGLSGVICVCLLHRHSESSGYFGTSRKKREEGMHGWSSLNKLIPLKFLLKTCFYCNYNLALIQCWGPDWRSLMLT